MPYQGKYILVAVDGTGSHEWRREDGQNSHVFRFYRDFATPATLKQYWNGPGAAFGGEVAGAGSGNTIDSAVQFVRSQLRREIGPCLDELGGAYSAQLRICRQVRRRSAVLRDIDQMVRVVLVGHSRGGLIAINVARRLPIPVHFMGLYDAVDMHPSLDAGYIANVRATYHARRHPAMQSRASWGNCGLTSNGRYHERLFMTTHGGIGGDPVLRPTGVVADYACSTETLSAHISAVLGQDRGQLCLNQSLKADHWIRNSATQEGIVF